MRQTEHDVRSAHRSRRVVTVSFAAAGHRPQLGLPGSSLPTSESMAASAAEVNDEDSLPLRRAVPKFCELDAAEDPNRFHYLMAVNRMTHQERGGFTERAAGSCCWSSRGCYC